MYFSRLSLKVCVLAEIGADVCTTLAISKFVC